MYCNFILSAESDYSDELKKVCQSLLDYAKQARIYFGYNNEGLTSDIGVTKYPSTRYTMKITGNLPNGSTYIGSSLILGDEVILRHYFTGDSNRFVYKCINTTKSKVVYVTSHQIDSMYAFYVDIKVSYLNISDMYELTLRTAGSTHQYSLKYGALTYLKCALDSDMNNNLVYLCDNLYSFSVAVQDYKKSVS